MSREPLNYDGIRQIAFDERYAVPLDQTAPWLFSEFPQSSGCAANLVDPMATAYLIAVLESICIRELRAFTDPRSQTVVGVVVECRHHAQVAEGALLRVSGWVERVGEDEVTFRVQAHDEQEQVCEASIRWAILRRERIAQRITRKREAIVRRELYRGA
jgi:fluoroacetyl-CoA thioesterase